MESERYIGDGVYVRFDGFQFWLRTPVVGSENMIALEPSTLNEFLRYVRDIKESLKNG